MKKTISVLTLVLSLFLMAAPSALSQVHIRKGDIVPELVTKDIHGQPFNLKEYNQGRYIILDFWASWCKPCIQEIPAVIRHYNKFRGKTFQNAPNGFDIVSISLDMERSRMIKRINKSKIPWEVQISDFKGYMSEFAETFGVEYIPYFMLISPEGQLIGTFISAEALFEALAHFEKK